jgi:predicted nucleic acid-binding protein
VTLVDSNVLIDLFIDDPVWSDWLIARLRERSLNGPLYINDVVYAESSTRSAMQEDFEAALKTADIRVRPIPPAALFLAGKAYRQYRRAGGTRTGVLPDFFIGAQASTERLALLTRDFRRYNHYFPDVALIMPEDPAS